MTRWTAEQKLAVEADGRDVLVTASAGTGKTSVLAGRCVRMLSDPAAAVDVRQMLILTFTNAAAEEMRTRISDSLRKACESGGNARLKRQLMLIDAAHIGTIHSFCQRLIREHFYRLGLDPSFRLVNEDEQRLLKSQILDDTVEWAWQQANLVGPLGELLGGRNVRTKGYSFLEQIVAISDFLDGIADRRNWCDRAVAANDLMGQGAGEVAAQQMDIIRTRLLECRQQIQFAIRLDELMAGGHWRGQMQNDRLSYIDACLASLEKGDLRECARVIETYANDKHSFRNRPRGMSEEVKETVQAPVKKAMETLTKLHELAILNPVYNDAIGPAARIQSMVLIELVKRFDHLYGQAKMKANCLDFADLEHSVLQLLQGPDGPSDIAASLRRRYKAIFVDEYQDINSVQKQILTLLTAGRNVFAVGDVKQSIYAFRGAVPEIFLYDLKAAQTRPAEALRIDLTGNFRSRQELLDVVNAVFGRIMTVETARLNYDETAKLTSRLQYVPIAHDAGKAVELHLLDTGTEGNCDAGDMTEGDNSEDKGAGSSGSFTNAQLQAALIAARIQEMVDSHGKTQFSIYDKDKETYRPVEYRDIVVLMRSMSGANDYAEILSLAGIPIHSQSATGYFEATEVTDSLALLKVLDNPQRDIELAAVLRSPMFRVSDTELLKIRLADTESGSGRSRFHECVYAYAASGPDAELREKVASILRTLDQWRTCAAQEGIAAMLWQAYRQTGYLSFVAAMPKGRQRRANLLDLHSRAVQFAGFATTPASGLGAFVEFIEKLMQEGGDYKPADVMAPGENAVRIMSVHKSKGLEFPVVVLAGMERRFNFQDIAGDCLFDERTTLGLGIIDSHRHVHLRSMANEVVAERKLTASLAEEMRILYVAMTRAREKLILTAARPKDLCRRVLRNGAMAPAGPLPGWMLSACRSSLEWLLYGLSDRREMLEAFGLDAEATALAQGHLLDMHILSATEQNALARSITKARQSHRATTHTASSSRKDAAALVAAVTDSLSWEYPYEAATDACAKTSVTQLTHRQDEFAQVDHSAAFGRAPLALQVAGDSSKVEPLLAGSATHLVIQSLDISQPVDEIAVGQTLSSLVKDGMLAHGIADGVDVRAVAAFFKTELGQIVLRNHDRVLREWPFTLAVPLSEYAPQQAGDPTGENVIVQGIVDMLVRLPDRLVIVDFKTDRIRRALVPQRAQMYRNQLDLYARAAGIILSTRNVEKCLYFLNCCELMRL